MCLLDTGKIAIRAQYRNRGLENHRDLHYLSSYWTKFRSFNHFSRNAGLKRGARLVLTGLF